MNEIDAMIGVDLKGKDSVPETVDHAVIVVDPLTDLSWATPVVACLHNICCHSSAPSYPLLH